MMIALKSDETELTSGGSVRSSSEPSLFLTSLGKASNGWLLDELWRSKVGNGAVNGRRIRTMKENAQSLDRLCFRRRTNHSAPFLRRTPPPQQESCWTSTWNPVNFAPVR